MTYQQRPEPQPPQLGATFVPGGFDDYYMPAPQLELVSPSPQRIMPEVPENMQDNIEHLELAVNPPRHADRNSQASQTSHTSRTSQTSHGQVTLASQGAQHQGAPHLRQSQHYESFATNTTDIPNFSPFPRLNNPPQNVPPTYEEKEAILESARLPVLNSNDPEMQLAWAQDALAYAQIMFQDEERTAEIDKRSMRPATPPLEHQLKLDAMNIVEFLAQQHHPKAEFMKGMWLEFGNFGVRQDKREAFRCYARAAERGYARAEYRMGMQFEQSNDHVKALHHYRRGAEAGDAASNYRLGMMTLMGQNGEKQDPPKGIQMLRIAAERADENAPQGAYVLGMLYARELPQVTVPEILLPFDLQAARMNMEKAAYLGFAKAQVKMGAAHELCSLGCEFDPALSLHYNALAAKQGEAEAEMAISKWFLCGHEGLFNKNEELAFVYANRAAHSGLPTAEFAMGYFYEIGLHVPVDITKATDWYEKAAKQENEDAKGRLESLRKSQQLSMKDHENVAINRIKSQYGSKRGGRPERFRAQAPALPSVSDEAEEPTQQQPTGRPPRHSSMTPYPMSDGPPQTSQPERPATVAPYPLDDRPPQTAGRPGFAGGFAPELRSQSAVNAHRPTSDGAFGINPDVYNQPPAGRLGPPHSNTMNLPLRPATTADPTGASGRGGRPPNQRIVSGPPGQIGHPRPPQASVRPPQASGPPSQPTPLPKINIGYSAPASQGRGQRPVQGSHGPPQGNDIGFVAPLQPRKSSTPSPNASTPPQHASDRPGRADNRTPGGAHPPRASSRPEPTEHPHRQSTDPRMSGGLPLGPAANKAPRPPVQGQGGKPVKPEAHGSMAPVRPLGSGPKTFEEMGVPAQKNESECVIM